MVHGLERHPLACMEHIPYDNCVAIEGALEISRAPSITKKGDMTTIWWSFLERDAEVEMLGEKVAYSWTCDPEGEHTHTIECLWVWHNCSRVLDPPADEHWTSL